MNKKILIPLFFFLLSNTISAQNQDDKEINLIKVSHLTALDSIKLTFVNHNKAISIDSFLLKELSNVELYNDMFMDITETNIDEAVSYDLSTDLLKERLRVLNAKTPFEIEYNEALENVIKSFLKNRKKSFERLMAISEYYFPMFEEALSKYNVPLEIKYLAIIESALNPRAKSRVGATGLWQFMYPTGKQFNLEVNSYVDERFDPLKATEAACQYLSSLYNIFGDWDLVLASYNAGPGNVSKAIRRSGGYQNYWNIRKNLPRETQGYLPAFLATMYIYEYHKEHGINPKKAQLAYFATDTIEVKKQITFDQISQLLNIPVAQIQFLNPIYKLDIIPTVLDKKHYLRLPIDKIGLFTSNEEKIYAYVQSEFDKREKPLSKLIGADKIKVTSVRKSSTTHTVRRGDNLGSIAGKYGVTVANIKKWNRMSSNMVKAGQKIKIHNNKVDMSTGNQLGFSYIVKNGDSLFTIAKKYPGVSVDNIKKWNDINGNSIKPGMKLKIRG